MLLLLWTWSIMEPQCIQQDTEYGPIKKQMTNHRCQHLYSTWTTAEGNTIEIQDFCLDTEQNTCNFEISPVINIKMILRYTSKRWVCFSTPCEDTEIDNPLNHIQVFMFVNLLRTEAVILTIEPPVASFQLKKTPLYLNFIYTTLWVWALR